MYRPAPDIDPRSAQDIFDAVSGRLAETKFLGRTPDGSPSDLRWSRPDGPAEAMIRIFARYAEIIASRLNRVPEKNLVAFLNLLGVTPVPPLPARVPLTFIPVETVPDTIRVPALTEVAAAPAEGETEPVVFETERSIELTTGRLRHLFQLDPANDSETDLLDMADAVVADDAPAWQNVRTSDHILFLAHAPLFRLATGARLRLRFDIQSMPPTPGSRPEVEWRLEGADQPVVLKPVSDTTAALTRSGEVLFEDLPPWPEHEFRGVRNLWISCRLLTPLPAAQSSHWAVTQVQITTEVRKRYLPADFVMRDGQAADVSKDFFPFGIRPVFGSTLYIASQPAFCQAGTRVTLNVKLTNPYDSPEPPPIPAVYVDGHPRIWWEYWNGAVWNRLSETDSTKYLRLTGAVGFRIPDDMVQATVNGVQSCWIRARLASGHYGEEERWEPPDPANPAAGPQRRPATLSPPSIEALTIDYELDAPVDSPEVAIVCNGRLCEDITPRARANSAFLLFGFPLGQQRALYLGFEAPDRIAFVNRSMTLYLRIPDRVDRPVSRAREKSEAAAFAWQYWSSSAWLDLEVIDGTEGMSRSGLVSFIVPEDAAVKADFADGVCHWLRIVARSACAAPLAQLRGVLRNTTMAMHSVRLENETIGSSDGTPNQRFLSARTPILRELVLQVREADLPSDAEQVLRRLSPPDIEVPRDERGRALAAWVRWTETGDFLDSQPEDRHYTVDRQTGEIRFGDGRHGRIPPRNGNNIRLRRYQVGGGNRGNKPANTITQLRSAIPYVQAATNLVPASGGFDREDMQSVYGRGARLARHRGRAVTAEDYEDLARLASPEVARSRCVSMRDLAADPDGRRYVPGTVSLIVVSRTHARKPLPSVPLLDRVRCYIDERREPAADLIVVGPEYVRVAVEVEFVPEIMEESAAVRDAMTQRIDAFLHPLYGGLAQGGWSFGQLPQRSDLYGICASVPGVHHVSALRVVTTEDRPGVEAAGNFLIYSGEHHVRVSSGSLRGSSGS